MHFTGKSGHIRTILIIMTSLAFFMSCAAVEMQTDFNHVRGSLLKSTDVDSKAREIARANTEAMQWYCDNEWEYNRHNKNQPPQLGLALSGGGIRSAAFSIGVMKGLHKREILDNVDIMSAVSGGSYALSWYYVQQLKPEINQSDLFSEENLNKLAAKGKMYRYAEIAGSAAVNLIWSPVNFLLNGLFASNTNTTSSRAYYEHVIKRTFYSDPDRSLLSLNNAIIQAPTLKKFRTSIIDDNLPYFVISTTADIDIDKSYFKSRLKNAVFEFTPLRIGSDGFGYEDEFPDYTIADAVSISGAALDSSQVPGKFESLLASMLNMDQGYYIKNYADKKKKYRFFKKITPFPFHYLWEENSHRRDHKGMDIYLTDGGHSENLGAYSLVRRFSGHIIIVDAEYDKKYEFDAYHRLKDAIKNEMHAELIVEDIENRCVDGKMEKDEDATKNEIHAMLNVEDTEDRCVDWKRKKDAVATGSIAYLLA
jgi:hypothetical protein